MTIPPIETRYAGCRFRSRLEARWAVFFDHLGDFGWENAPHEEDDELINNLVETLDEPVRSALFRTRRRATTMTVISPAVFVEGRFIYAFPIAFPNTDIATPEQVLNPVPCDFVVVNPRIQAAYEAARSARFEHGESG